MKILATAVLAATLLSFVVASDVSKAELNQRILKLHSDGESDVSLSSRRNLEGGSTPTRSPVPTKSLMPVASPTMSGGAAIGSITSTISVGALVSIVAMMLW